MAALIFSLITPSASTIDPVDAIGKVIASEKGHLVATTVVCVSSLPVAGIYSSASMHVAYEILISKILG